MTCPLSGEVTLLPQGQPDDPVASGRGSQGALCAQLRVPHHSPSGGAKVSTYIIAMVSPRHSLPPSFPLLSPSLCPVAEFSTRNGLPAMRS